MITAYDALMGAGMLVAVAGQEAGRAELSSERRGPEQRPALACDALAAAEVRALPDGNHGENQR